MEDVTKVYAWQEAMELSKELIRICEEFSDGEKNVLAWHIRQAVVEIPASIAADIELGRKDPTLEPVIRLATELELVHRIYPAIDTDGAPEKLKALVERMKSDAYLEREPEAEEEEGVDTEVQAQASGVVTVDKPAAKIQPTGGTMIEPADDDEEDDNEPAPVAKPQPRVLSITTEDPVTMINPDKPGVTTD